MDATRLLLNKIAQMESDMVRMHGILFEMKITIVHLGGLQSVALDIHNTDVGMGIGEGSCKEQHDHAVPDPEPRALLKRLRDDDDNALDLSGPVKRLKPHVINNPEGAKLRKKQKKQKKQEKEKEGQHKCSQCIKSYLNRNSLNYHVRMKHVLPGQDHVTDAYLADAENTNGTTDSEEAPADIDPSALVETVIGADADE